MLKKLVLPALVVTAVVFSPLNADATPVDDLETEAAKVTDVYAAVVPVAVGAAVFGIGMAIIKRVAFA